MKRILIIEDDVNIAELERDYLRLNGYEVQMVHDGDEGLRQALTGQFDMVVVDLMLPGRSGFDIIRGIRAQFEIPVIVVSARNEDIDKIRGLDVGADDYLTKPFSPAELAARIRSHISRYERLKGQTGRKDVIVHGSLEVHTLAHKVLIDGREVQMTAKEYELLVFLASNPNMVFTREHLFTAIWGDDSFGDTATVPVHIQKIRKKIEKNPQEPRFIETLWGAGYRFNPADRL